MAALASPKKGGRFISSSINQLTPFSCVLRLGLLSEAGHPDPSPPFLYAGLIKRLNEVVVLTNAALEILAFLPGDFVHDLAECDDAYGIARKPRL